jgi:hypothetical protein
LSITETDAGFRVTAYDRTNDRSLHKTFPTHEQAREWQCEMWARVLRGELHDAVEDAVERFLNATS